MYASARSVRQMATEMENASRASSGFEQAGGAAQGIMYGIGGASRLAGYGMVAAAGAVSFLGIQFNATMESNALAFEHFSGSAQEAQKFTRDLFEIAKATPFGFEDITTAGRRLLAFGFNVEETTNLLDTLGDTLAYTGGSSDEIYRITKAFGDIRAKGRLMQQELNQLSNVGIPVVPLLAEELQLTDKQLRNIGRSGIDSATAIDALTKVLERTYGGGAEKYMETFNGQLQRLKDNIAAASGSATSPFFEPLKNALTGLNNFLEDTGNNQGAIKFFQDFIRIVGTGLVAGFELVKGAAQDFLGAIEPAAPFFDNVLGPLLKGLAEGVLANVVLAWKVLIAVITITAKLLGWLGERLGWASGLFEFLGNVIGFLFGGVILKAIALLGKFGGVFKFVGVVASALAVPINLVNAAFAALFRGVIFGVKVFASMSNFLSRTVAGAIEKVGGWFSGLSNIIWTAAGKALAAVTSRFGQFDDMFFAAGVSMKNALIGGLKGIGNAILRVFSGGIAFAGDIGRALADWLNRSTPLGDKVDLPSPLPDFTLPALASGGYLAAGGFAWVGEKGPELVKLPTGSQVFPNRAATVRKGASSDQWVDMVGRGTGAEPGVKGPNFEGSKIELHAPIYLDRRQIGEAVGDYFDEREARR